MAGSGMGTAGINGRGAERKAQRPALQSGSPWPCCGMDTHDAPGTMGADRKARLILPRLNDAVPLKDLTSRSGVNGLCDEAVMHEEDRLETVAEFFALMSVLAWAGILSGDNAASKGRTHYQDGTGSKANRTEAAHCIPQQVLINGRYPHELLGTESSVHQCGLKPLPVYSKLVSLFARTNKTSIEVNDTDGSIESVSGSLGIKIAFVKWTDHLLDILEKRPPKSKVEVLRSAQEAYLGFFEAEKMATRTKLNRRLSDRTTDSARRAKNQVQVRLLLAFMQAQARSLNPPPLHAAAFKAFWEEVAREDD